MVHAFGVHAKLWTKSRQELCLDANAYTPRWLNIQMHGLDLYWRFIPDEETILTCVQPLHTALAPSNSYIIKTEIFRTAKSGSENWTLRNIGKVLSSSSLHYLELQTFILQHSCKVQRFQSCKRPDFRYHCVHY